MRQVMIVGMLVAAGLFLQSSLWAQGRGTMYPVSGEKLDTTLGGLQDSVTRLMDENRSMVAENNVLRKKVEALQSQMAGVEAEGNKLADQMKVLDRRYQEKVENLRSLEIRLASAQVELAAVKAEQEKAREPLDSRIKEEMELRSKAEALQKEIQDLKAGRVPPGEATGELSSLRSQKADLQRQLQDAAAALASAKEEWQSVSSASIGKARLEDLRAERDRLHADLKLLSDDVSGLKEAYNKQEAARKTFPGTEVSTNHILQMEQDVARLGILVDAARKEIAALGGGEGAGSQGNDPARMAQESRYQELQTRYARLKDEMDRLRREMISLDKKKTSLEAALYAPAY